MNFAFWFMFVIFVIGGVVFLVGGLIGALAVWLFMQRRVDEYRKEADRVEREKAEEEEIASNLEGFNDEMQKKIEERKQRIIEKLNEENYLQTGEAAEMLDVSRRTALRHLSELEAEGKIKQTHETGRNTAYKLVG